MSAMDSTSFPSAKLMNPMPNLATSYPLFVVIIVLHAILISAIIFILIFYFLPHQIVFGTLLSGLSAFAWIGYNAASPYGKYFSAVKDGYFSLVFIYPSYVLSVTLVLLVALAVWILVMFDTIYARYQYLAAINRAIKFVAAEQFDLPSPENLATAFNAMPHRPEVPLILIRASRLLAFDDQPENFYLYMKRFVGAVDEAAVIKRAGELELKNSSALASDAPVLPVLDPIHLLANFKIEVRKEDRIDAYRSAIELLLRHRTGPGDGAAILQRSIMEIELELMQLRDEGTPEERIKARKRIAEQGIQSLLTQIDPQTAAQSFNSLSFATNHVYQEALDELAQLKAIMLIGEASPAQCGDRIEDIAATFQRILVLRSRLRAPNDIIWWRPPGKLSLYYLFMFLSGQRGVIGKMYNDEFSKCPALIERLKAIHSAVAFKSFQEPEPWAQGTPISSTFNGAAAAALLRGWLRLGW